MASGQLPGPAAPAPPPPDPVLTAFGLRGSAVPLPGGRGRSWLVGDTVLKPFDGSPTELSDLAALAARVARRTGLRFSQPRPASDESWIVAGWSASRYEPGRPVPGSWARIVDVGRRLHTALRDEPDFPWRARRSDPWADADQMAWGDTRPGTEAHGRRPDTGVHGRRPPAPSGDVEAPTVAALLAARRLVHGRAQLVHGDLTRNVLFDDHSAPLVIDFSLYWRPPAFASAVVLADALLFEDAGPDVVALLADEPDRLQYLLRALLFRMFTDQLVGASSDEIEAQYAAAAAVVLDRLSTD